MSTLISPTPTPINQLAEVNLAALEQAVANIITDQLKSAGLWRTNAQLDYGQDFLAMGLEQLDLFEIIIKLEDTFKLEISDDEGLQLTCVNHVVDYLQERGVIVSSS